MKRRISHLIVVTLLSAAIIIGLCPQVYADNGEDPSKSTAITQSDSKTSKDTLTYLIALARFYYEDNYTTDSFAVLKTAISNAQSVLDNENATEDEILEVVGELYAAIDSLEKTLYTQLTDLVTEAETLDSSLYTKESFKAVEDAIAAAYIVINKDSTQDEIQSAYDTLIDALDNLVAAEDPSSTPASSKDPSSTPASSKDTSNTSSKKTPAIPKTSDNMAVGFVLLTLALAGVSTLILKRKNK